VQAAVFYAQDSISHREVCLKVYDGASRRAAAKREASVLRLLGGETAPVLYDAFVEGDRTILVIEFADHQYSDLATFSRARAAASPYRGIASGLSTIATRAVALRLLQCADKLHDKGARAQRPQAGALSALRRRLEADRLRRNRRPPAGPLPASRAACP